MQQAISYINSYLYLIHSYIHMNWINIYLVTSTYCQYDYTYAALSVIHLIASRLCLKSIWLKFKSDCDVNLRVVSYGS